MHYGNFISPTEYKFLSVFFSHFSTLTHPYIISHILKKKYINSKKLLIAVVLMWFLLPHTSAYINTQFCRNILTHIHYEHNNFRLLRVIRYVCSYVCILNVHKKFKSSLNTRIKQLMMRC